MQTGGFDHIEKAKGVMHLIKIEARQAAKLRTEADFRCNPPLHSKVAFVYQKTNPLAILAPSLNFILYTLPLFYEKHLVVGDYRRPHPKPGVASTWFSFVIVGGFGAAFVCRTAD